MWSCASIRPGIDGAAFEIDDLDAARRADVVADGGESAVLNQRLRDDPLRAVHRVDLPVDEREVLRGGSGIRWGDTLGDSLRPAVGSKPGNRDGKNPSRVPGILVSWRSHRLAPAEALVSWDSLPAMCTRAARDLNPAGRPHVSAATEPRSAALQAPAGGIP